MTTTTATDPLPFPAAHVDGAGQLLQFLRSAQDSTISEIAAAMGLKTRNPILGRLFRLRQRGIVRPDQVGQEARSHV